MARSDINTVQDDLKNDINNLRKDLNIRKDKTETELNKINQVLKEFDSSQHFFGEKYESQKENTNDLKKDYKKNSFLKTRRYTDRFWNWENVLGKINYQLTNWSNITNPPSCLRFQVYQDEKMRTS